MTREEKELLLKDLCGRLPYRVNVLSDFYKKFDGGLIGMLCRIEPYVGKEHPELIGQYLLYQQSCLTPLVIDEVRPYLRPMSSMTEEELKELWESCTVSLKTDLRTIVQGDYKCYDWLNSHHFDYRGLIHMGLALEAPEGMYKIRGNGSLN